MAEEEEDRVPVDSRWQARDRNGTFCAICIVVVTKQTANGASRAYRYEGRGDHATYKHDTPVEGRSVKTFLDKCDRLDPPPTLPKPSETEQAQIESIKEHLRRPTPFPVRAQTTFLKPQ